MNRLNMEGESRTGAWLRSKPRDLSLYAAIAICFGGLLLFYGSGRPLHHDLAGSVLSGRLAISLGQAYADYGIYFPPAEKVWFSLAARLSDLIGLRLDLTVVAMTSVVVLIGANLGYQVRRKAVGATPNFLFVSLMVLVILPISFKNVFGLREHLVIVGLWPYLVLRVSDPENDRIGWRLRALLGLWMGTTLLIKYLYSVLVVLVELVDALVQRKPTQLFRVENIVAGSVVALYLFCWLGIDPSQRAAIGAMFSGIDANLVDPSTNWLKVVENLGYAIVFLGLLQGFQVKRRLMALGLAMVVGTILVAWSQERWYTHHLFPIVAAYAGWWWMAKSHFRWWGHVVVAVCLSYAVIGQFLSTSIYQRQVAELDRAMRASGLSTTGKRVGLLNMHPSPYNQYLAAHGAVRWNALMNNAYVAADLKWFDTEENADKLPPPVTLDNPGRQMLHDQMLRLWEDMPPDVLILDHSTSWPLRYIKVDWLHEFSEDQRFNAIMKRYRPVFTHRGPLMTFTYYVRTDGSRHAKLDS